jgi:hypothetical protein
MVVAVELNPLVVLDLLEQTTALLCKALLLMVAMKVEAEVEAADTLVAALVTVLRDIPVAVALDTSTQHQFHLQH